MHSNISRSSSSSRHPRSECRWRAPKRTIWPFPLFMITGWSHCRGIPVATKRGRRKWSRRPLGGACWEGSAWQRGESWARSSSPHRGHHWERPNHCQVSVWVIFRCQATADWRFRIVKMFLKRTLIKTLKSSRFLKY